MVLYETYLIWVCYIIDRKFGKKMLTAENPNPPCPKCKSKEVFEIVHELTDTPEERSSESWVHSDGICDVHPDKWKCGDCDFRWYSRGIVERDLDLLTWQLDHEEDDKIKEALRNRIADLRTVITIVANAE